MVTVTFFCDTSWENSILFSVKIFWTFWKHLGKGYKITFALNSWVSSFCFSQNLYCLYGSLGSAASSFVSVELVLTSDK